MQALKSQNQTIFEMIYTISAITFFHLAKVQSKQPFMVLSSLKESNGGL